MAGPVAGSQRAGLLPAGCSSSSRSRCSRNSKEISSRARPARQKSRATSLMVLPPILLWTEGSHSTMPPQTNCSEVPAAPPAGRPQQFCP